jgi:hypothetical protein
MHDNYFPISEAIAESSSIFRKCCQIAHNPNFKIGGGGALIALIPTLREHFCVLAKNGQN